MRKAEWWIAATIGLVALAARLPMLGASPYGDEAAHFAMARTLGFLDRTVHYPGLADPLRLYPLTLGRPAFALLYAPGAWLGFTAFRLEGMLVSSALAATVYLLCRRLGSKRSLAALAGTAMALHPSIAVWGARVFPDAAMSLLVVGALMAWQAQRPVLCAVLLLLACLTKETAIPVAGAVALWEVLGWWRSRHAVDANVDANVDATPRRRTAVLAPALAFVLGPSGIIASYLAYPLLPGWTSGASLLQATDTLLVSAWLFPLALLGLLNPRARLAGAAFVALLLFYWLFILARHGGVNGWYAMLPVALALICCVAGLQTLAEGRRLAKVMAWTCSAALLVGLVGAVVGTNDPFPSLHPFNGGSEPGLAATVTSVNAEQRFLSDARAVQAAAHPKRVTEVDLQWYWIFYPFEGQQSTEYLNTQLLNLTSPQNAVVQDALAHADLLWLQDYNTTFDQDLKETLHGCQVFAEGPLVGFDLQACRAASMPA